MKDVLRVLCQTVLAEMRTNIYSTEKKPRTVYSMDIIKV